ncbi:MAG: hypothetical protein EHM61_20290, partial [Acidobacteria bacterium]
MKIGMQAEGDQLIEALRNGEIDAVISRDQLFLLRLLEEEEALEQRVRDGTKVIAQQVDQLRSLATELTLTEQRERSRIAEVLHDHLQQLLVAVHMEIGALQTKTLNRDTADHLTRIHSMIGDCINATRLL